MAHDREDIRKAFELALTGLATTSARVYRSRVYPMSTSKLPGLIIYTETEDSDAPTMGTSVQARRLELIVEGYVKASPSLIDDYLDDIALEVETAIGADRTLSGACETCWLESTTLTMLAGEQPVGIVRMQFTVFYRS